MALVKDEILVIKGTDYSEADKILTVYGRNRGKYSLMAKGVRKIESKNRPSVQTLCTSKITYYEGRNLGVLVEAAQIKAPEFDRDQLTISGKFLVIINKLLPEDEKDEILYQRMQNLVYGNLSLRDVNQFRIWLLDHLGYLPDLHRCVKCGSDKDLRHIDLNLMVMICDNCFDNEIDSTKYHLVDAIKYESSEMDEAIDRFLLRILQA